jgi:hypothetical protein
LRASVLSAIVVYRPAVFPFARAITTLKSSPIRTQSPRILSTAERDSTGFTGKG